MDLIIFGWVILFSSFYFQFLQNKHSWSRLKRQLLEAFFVLRERAGSHASPCVPPALSQCTPLS